MKKVLLIAIVGLSVIACKNDNKNTTKDNKATSEAANVENKAPEPEVVKDAITDSAGVYKLKYKLEKGQSYPFVLEQKDVQSVTVQGQTQSQSSTTTDKASFTVTNFANGIYDMDITFKSKKQIGEAQGQKLNVDTDAPEPKSKNLQIFWRVNKALMGSTLKMKMDETGKIISFTGFEPIYTKVSEAINSFTKEAKARTSIMDGFKQSFNEEALKLQFKTNLSLFPQKGMKIGDSFTESMNLSEDGKLKNSTVFTLSKVENGLAVFTVKGGIPKKTDKQTQNGVTQTISLVGVQTGTLNLDVVTGWMKPSTLSMTSTQTQVLSDGTHSEQVVQKTVSTTKVNP